MDIICFSHLRWNFVYQRPQHLLSRFAKSARVFYIEEPIFHNDLDSFHVTSTKENVFVVELRLFDKETNDDVTGRQKRLISALLAEKDITKYAVWYYTPMALPISEHLNPVLTVYDCMDELSAFKFASPDIVRYEKILLAKADVVFTGGHSLYEAKKDLHENMHPFPSSIDKAHFSKARQDGEDPPDQAKIPHPRFGFYGVIDERFDIDLIAALSTKRPDWHFILIGPVVKIDPATLPQNPNIHYLGGKAYDVLPDYLRGWDIAMIPFMLNESTRYISPTKTPEYLAAGKPVISNAINDVVNPYGMQKLVHICHGADEFITQAEEELAEKNKGEWLKKVDEFLENNSWDATWRQMADIMNQKLQNKIF
jgi:glycosyltransferase involved in cell wall biosynthesis